VKKLKNRKAPGISGIPAELLINGKGTILLWLQVLFNSIWKSEIIPKDCHTGTIPPLWKKKGSRRECKNYRRIILLSVPDKSFSMVLLQQCFVHLQRLVLCLQFRRQAFNAYVNFKAAFDSVDRDFLLDILSNTGGLLSKYVRLHGVMHQGTESCLQVNGHGIVLTNMNRSQARLFSCS